MFKKCLFCNNRYRTKPCLANKSKFCCLICKCSYFKGKHLSPNSEFKKGFKPWNTNKKMNQKYRDRIRNFAKLGIIGIKGKKMSLEVRRKISLSQKGDKSPKWRGGITKQNELIRRSVEYKIWRESVFKRDDYTCRNCGERGGLLNSDHIRSYALFPEIRFDINNGQTLCKKCHDKKTKRDMVFITKEVRRRYYAI